MQTAEYSVRDVAELTKRAEYTVRKWCRDGILKARKPRGRDYVILADDFNKFWFGDANSAPAADKDMEVS